MASCNYCKVSPQEPLKRCVCGKVSYCSKECQAKDWKIHKPSCPPYTIREVPGKGRGLFATRKIKEGQIILEEYPFISLRNGDIVSFNEFKMNHYPNIDESTKAKILEIRDPAENLKMMDPETVEKLVREDPVIKSWREAKSDEISKIYRIVSANSHRFCEDPNLYSNITEIGLYNYIALINHGCVANASWTWVMGDFKRHQVRALMTIEKDQEILTSYWNTAGFLYSSRESRQQLLLEICGFLCSCSECSLEGEGEAQEENERIRAEIRETAGEMKQLMRCEGSASVPRRDVKKAMKLAQKKTKLVQKLNMRAMFVDEMIGFYHFAVNAKSMGISCPNDPDIFKQEALKYAKMFGDAYIYTCNKYI